MSFHDGQRRQLIAVEHQAHSAGESRAERSSPSMLSDNVSHDRRSVGARGRSRAGFRWKRPGLRCRLPVRQEQKRVDQRLADDEISFVADFRQKSRFFLPSATKLKPTVSFRQRFTRDFERSAQLLAGIFGDRYGPCSCRPTAWQAPARESWFIAIVIVCGGKDDQSSAEQPGIE